MQQNMFVLLLALLTLESADATGHLRRMPPGHNSSKSVSLVQQKASAPDGDGGSDAAASDSENEEDDAGARDDEAEDDGAGAGDEGKETSEENSDALGEPAQKPKTQKIMGMFPDSKNEEYQEAREAWATKMNKVERTEAKASDALQANLERQAELEDEISGLEGQEAHDATMKDINAHVKTVANETGTPLMAAFLGDMWKDMHTFSAPLLADDLKRELRTLEAQEEGLQSKHQAAKMHLEKIEWKAAEEAMREMKAIQEGKTLTRAEKKDEEEMEEVVAEEKDEAQAAGVDVSDGKKKDKEKKRARAEPSGKDGYEPMFTEETMPKVSPTVQCIVMLCTQYFIIYTMLISVRTANELSGGRYVQFEKILNGATMTVTYALALSILFLGVRMRAIQLSAGNTEKYGLPQWWVQWAMYACTFSVLLQVVVVVIIGFLLGGDNLTTCDDGHLHLENVGGTPLLVCQALRYTAMIGLYGGIVTIIIGVFTMPQPEEIWHGERVPVSPAVMCTILLTTTFLLAYLAMALVRSIRQMKGEDEQFRERRQMDGSSEFYAKLEVILSNAKYTVNLAPMCAILFIATRMRALQIDPKNGNPQWWAQYAMFGVTFAIMAQFLMVTLLPMFGGKGVKIETGPSEGEVRVIYQSDAMNVVSPLVRCTCLVCIYGGVILIVNSIFLIQAEDPVMTPPISPAAKCTICLAVLYFAAYTMLFAANTFEEQMKMPGMGIRRAVCCFEAATKAVMFAPMLATLFWAARMRALQLTRTTDNTVPPTAGPQPWAQQAMYCATWAVLVQVLMVVAVPWIVGRHDEGNVDTSMDGAYKAPVGTRKWVAYLCEGVRWTSAIAMYGGAIVVIAAIFVMTPETLPPYSSYEMPVEMAAPPVL